MTWVFLRFGWGNTAAIFALALLPAVLVAGAVSTQHRAGETKADLTAADWSTTALPGDLSPIVD